MRRLLFILLLPASLTLFADAAATLETRVGEWRGDYLLKAPSHRIRAALIPALPPSGETPALGAAVNAAPVLARRLVLLFPPAPGSDPEEKRIIIPEQTVVRFGNREIPIDGDAVTALLDDADAFCPGTLDDSEQAQLSHLAAAFQIPLKTCKVIPLFVSAGTPDALLEGTLRKLLEDRDTLLVAVSSHKSLPDGEGPVHRVAEALGFSALRTALGSTRKRKAPENEAVLFQESARQELAVHFDSKAPAFMTSFEARILLNLARDVITSTIRKEQSPIMPAFAENLTKHYGCQLTLLRGERTLAQHVTMPGKMPVSNAVVLGAFDFVKEGKEKVTGETLRETHLSLTLLSIPKPLDFIRLEDLYAALRPGRDGVFLTCDGRTTGFLPAVWEQAKTPERFIAALCAKLDLRPNDLIQRKATLMTFETLTVTE